MRDIAREWGDELDERDPPEFQRSNFVLRHWRGVRASVWMLWLGSLAVATAAFVALLLLHTGGSATGVPPALQVQRNGVPLSVASTTTSSTTLTTPLNSVDSTPSTSTTSTTSPKVIVVRPRQTVSQGDATGSGATDGGTSGGAKSTTGNTVADH